jgi:hypothetical protein
MKKLSFLFIALAFAGSLLAQSDKYTAAMKKNLALLDSAKTPDQFNTLVANFERIGDAEKTQWLPYYYAAMCQLSVGWMGKGGEEFDVTAGKADAIIAKGEVLEGGNNSEMYCLKSMAATQHMMVDPMNRWMQYGALSSEMLEKAIKADATNPRPYYLQARSTMSTPEQFGGGKKAAKPIIEKSVALYATFKPATDLHPTWGKADADAVLKQCQ